MFFRKQLFCLTAIVALLVAPLAFTYADSLADQENALRAQLAQEQALLKQLESKRDEIVKTGNTITSDIKQLDSQIAATKKQIDTKNKLIANLNPRWQRFNLWISSQVTYYHCFVQIHIFCIMQSQLHLPYQHPLKLNPQEKHLQPHQTPHLYHQTSLPYLLT